MNGPFALVEPRLSLDCNHGIEETDDYSERRLSFMFRSASLYQICLEVLLLEPNIVRLGPASPISNDAEIVA